jgi:hypothetical protein
MTIRKIRFVASANSRPNSLEVQETKFEYKSKLLIILDRMASRRGNFHEFDTPRFLVNQKDSYAYA